jgi:hypothetical protein
MKTIEAEKRSLRQLQAFGSNLPAGVSDTDCDGPLHPHAGASESRLWQISGSRTRDRLSETFAESHLEFLRDAILDAEDAALSSRPEPKNAAASIGQSLWAAWLSFRNHALREMRRTGELSVPPAE